MRKLQLVSAFFLFSLFGCDSPKPKGEDTRLKVPMRYVVRVYSGGEVVEKHIVSSVPKYQFEDANDIGYRDGMFTFFAGDTLVMVSGTVTVRCVK